MYDIAVIGGGMAGAGLSCALAGEKVRIALIEEKAPRRGRRKDARGIALSQSSRSILEEIGLWSKLTPYACPIEHIHVSVRGRFGCVRMAADMLDLDALGHVVPAHELGRAMSRQIAKHDNIEVLTPATAEGIEREADSIAVQVRQADEETVLRCRLLVIADGALSGLRELAGIKTSIHDYRQAAIVANVTVSREHRNTAYERFVPGGLVAMLPLPGGARCVAVMVAPGDQADDYLQLDNAAYLERLQSAFGKRLGEFSEPGPRQSYPLFLLQPERQIDDRIVLLGNAAHTIHPNGAQGFNLILRDMAGLAGQLRATLCEDGDVGAAAPLAAYASSRKADQRRVVRFTDLLQKTFSATNPLQSALRDSALLALDTLPPLKKAFIRRATGLRTPTDLNPARALGRRRRTAGKQGPGAASTSTRVRASLSRPPDTELLVIGGGVIGGAMASLAASAGIDCILVERNRAPAGALPKEDARVLALTLASRNILSSAQVWRRLAERDVGMFKRMQVWDENGSGSLCFDSADIGQPTLGYIVRQDVLARALETVWTELPGVSTHTGAEPVSLGSADKAVTVALSDGRELSARLLVAADGVGSRIRQLAGIEYPVRRYQQTAVAGIVQTELEHGQVARQRFLTDGPLAFLPMADPRRCGVVWSTAPEHAEELSAMDQAAFQQALEDAFEHALGALTDIGVRQSFPLQRAQARRYCSERIALVGDAAHCVHPLAGQGANLGLLDVAGLFQLVSAAARKGRDPGSSALLRKYEGWRKSENFMVMMTLEGLKYLFENQTLPIPGLRNAGMGLYDSFPALKNFTMRRATGLEGDVPDFARLD